MEAFRECTYATGSESLEDGVVACPSFVLASLGVGRRLV